LCPSWEDIVVSSFALSSAIAAALTLAATIGIHHQPSALLDPSSLTTQVEAQAKSESAKTPKPPTAWAPTELCDAPSGLTAGATAMDAVKRRAYLIGGMSPKSGDDSDSEMNNNVRILDLDSAKPEWKFLATGGTIPTKRAWGAAAISQKTRTLYYFGGYGDKPGAEPDAAAELLNDFYALNLETFIWSRISPPDARDYPGVRDVHVLAINESSQTLWLSGGIGEASATAFTARDDLWSYRIADGLWKQHTPRIALAADQTKPTKGIPDARFGHAMVVDNEGRLLIAGGQSARLRTQTTSWVYDPRSDRLTRGPSLPDGRSGGVGFWHPALKALVYVAGQSESGEHDDVIAWRPGDDQWFHCGRTGAPSYYGAAWLDQGGKGPFSIIALPGQRDASRPKPASKTIRLSPKGDGTPATLANMMVQDGLPIATTIGEGPGNRYALNSVFDPKDGRIFAFGGQENVFKDGKMSDTKWHGGFRTYDTRGKSPKWEPLALKDGSTQPKERSYAAMAIAPAARQIWLFGGFGPPDNGGQGAVFRNDLWVFDLAASEWKSIPQPEGAAWPSPRDAHPLIVSDDEKFLYTFGGLAKFAATGLESHSDLWRYDIAKNEWTELKQAEGVKGPDARFFNGMVNMGGGKALVFGGFRGNGSGQHTDMWELNLSTGAFKELAKPSGDEGHGVRSAFAFAWDAKHKRVLMAGGSRSGVTDDIFAFTPSKGIWEPVGHTTLRSAYGTAVCDPATGALYYFGGTLGSFFDEHCENRITKWMPPEASASKPSGTSKDPSNKPNTSKPRKD